MKTKFVFWTSVFFGVYLVFYFLLQVLSVDIALTMVGQNSDKEVQIEFQRHFRQDLPPWQRLLINLNDLSPFSLYSVNNESIWYNEDILNSGFSLPVTTSIRFYAKPPYLGRSFQSKELVHKLLWPKLKITLILAIVSIFLSTILGIFLGVLAAVYYRSIIDQFIVLASAFGVSLPSFFIAIILSLTFGYYLSAFTGLSFKGTLVEYNDFGEPFFNWKNLVLPVIALSLRPLAIITQMTRNSMLDTLREDFIRTAIAKGLPKKIVVLKHGLMNALNPVVSSIAGWFGSLLAGTYFIETIFDIKGLGSITVNALMKFDIPVILGASLYVAFIFIVISLTLDYLYRILDPRIEID